MKFSVINILSGPIPSEHVNYNLDVYKLFNDCGLTHGRCFGSKSGYWDSHRENIVVFNGNVLLERRHKWLFWKRHYEKIWYGDLDITFDEEVLNKIARSLKCKLYVLRESDARFETAEKPNIERAVFWTDGKKNGATTSSFSRNVVRNSEGRLIEKSL